MSLIEAAISRNFRRDGWVPAWAGAIESFVARHRRKINYVHFGMFIVFIGLLAVPLFTNGMQGWTGRIPEMASFAIWGIWFPLVFLSVVFTGRSWCGLICPMGAASEWANRIGPKWAIPKWVQWPGTPIVSFLFITIWAQTAGARDHAGASAIVFGGTLLAAILLGFFFGRTKRAWCRHMCPIGLLLGVYSRIGLMDLAAKRPRPGGDEWTERGACPTMIDIPRKTESRHCIMCARCVSPPAPGGLYLRFRPPGHEVATIRAHNPNMSEVMFLFLGTGAALGGFLWLVLSSYQNLRDSVGAWAIDHGWDWIGNPGPVWLMSNYPDEREVFVWLDFVLITSYMLAWTIGITLMLSALTAAASWIAGRLGADGSFRQRFVELGYQFLPVAMISLLLGLGGKLFTAFTLLGVPPAPVAVLKAVLFIAGGLWSLYLGKKLLQGEGVAFARAWPAMIPGALGSILLGIAWYPAVFA